mgnify:CR=1 FL=1
MANKLYPVGIQNFEIIRKEDYLYVDKTAYVYHLTHDNGKSFFLGRPRRFGKTLNMSMLKYFLEIGADNTLFDGLYIYQRLVQRLGHRTNGSRLESISCVAF